MNWKDTEALFLSLRDCLLVCDDILAPMSSQRALRTRKEIGRLNRRLSETLARGELEWRRHNEIPISHVDSVEQRDQREPKLIPEDHLRKVCRPGQGAKTCCLVVAGRHGLECMLGTSLEPILRNRALGGEMVARSVNCDGPPEKGPQANDAVYWCPRCKQAGIPSTWVEHNCCTGCANHLRLGHQDPKQFLKEVTDAKTPD